ncbi:MAG: flagellar motor protein MotB [Myxococcales bacterium]|nr:flagellar motor protein MotB [Myxococcales bacterium]
MERSYQRLSAFVLGVGISVIGMTALAQAQPYNLDIQNFRPAMDSRSLITVERSRPLGTLEPSIGLYTSYAWRPLKQTIGGREQVLVEHLVTGQFVLTLGFMNIFEIGGGLPITVLRADGDGRGDEPLLAGDGIGDAQAHVKVRILDSEQLPVGLGLASTFRFPTGQDNAFVSDKPGVVIRPKLILDWHFGERVAMALNGGMVLRSSRGLDQPVIETNDAGDAISVPRNDVIRLGNAVSYGLGLGWSITPERLDLIVETYGQVPIDSDANQAMPLESLIGLKLYLLGNSFFTFGVSRGWLAQTGDPDARGFVGIVFEPTAGDRDRDGFKDDEDECPYRPEDVDGFEDRDGCPDEDNDMDRIPDILDQCPDVPEDKNGFEDEDGCPDGARDRDRDGITDRQDSCPDEPEDLDGFQDQDGCPELDNDNDGVPDKRDGCPLKPEDIDGFKDDDGCPELDNDGDRIPDLKDRCPDQAENYDGVDDEDGCPEAKIVVTREKLEINEKIYFETNKATIKDESHELLDAIGKTLTTYPQIKSMEIQGHTDSRGDNTYNLDLSQRRADAVRDYLVKAGVDSKRLSAQGYGESQPVDASENRAAWSKNRRVEFIIKNKK